jgi:2'-5' RNA ligase
VWADLVGSEDDLTAMRSIAQAVVAGVEPLGYFHDRRQFKPHLAVATITDATTVQHLEQVLAALDTLDVAACQVSEVALLQRGGGLWRAPGRRVRRRRVSG